VKPRPPVRTTEARRPGARLTIATRRAPTDAHARSPTRSVSPRLYCFGFFAVAVCVGAPVGAEPNEPPALLSPTQSLRCTIDNDIRGSSALEPVERGSLKLLGLEIQVKSNGTHIVPLRLETSPQGAANIRFRVFRLRDSVPDEVHPEWEYAGTRQTEAEGENSLGVYIRFVVRVSPAKRTRDAETYLEWVEQQAEGDPAQAEPLERVREQRADAGAALANLDFENEVGLFRIDCDYRSSENDTWATAVSSPPLYVNIRHVGNFFDQAGFRRGPAKREQPRRR
jgi:hypothetical protein